MDKYSKLANTLFDGFDLTESVEIFRNMSEDAELSDAVLIWLEQTGFFNNIMCAEDGSKLMLVDIEKGSVSGPVPLPALYRDMIYQTVSIMKGTYAELLEPWFWLEPGECVDVKRLVINPNKNYMVEAVVAKWPEDISPKPFSELVAFFVEKTEQFPIMEKVLLNGAKQTSVDTIEDDLYLFPGIHEFDLVYDHGTSNPRINGKDLLNYFTYHKTSEI